MICTPQCENAPPKMTLHPLTSKGGAFVLKLGLVFKKNTTQFRVVSFLAKWVRKAVKKTCRWHVFRPWENSPFFRTIQMWQRPCGMHKCIPYNVRRERIDPLRKMQHLHNRKTAPQSRGAVTFYFTPWRAKIRSMSFLQLFIRTKLIM